MQPNCCPTPPVFTIFLGDVKAMNLKAVYGDSGDPLDLTSCTEILIALPLASGAFTALSLLGGDVTITSPANLGKFIASAAAIGEISDGLMVGELQSFDVTFTISGNPFTVRYVSALTVNEVA